MPRIDISVVIPTYNRAPLACRAVDSVLAQTFRPAEVIVVDDGSTDDTRVRLERYGSSIRFVHQPNAGASVARNHGVEESHSPWIAFLDSDDVWVADHLERIVAAIEATAGGAAFYFSDMQLPVAEGGGTLWDHIGFTFTGPYAFTQNAASWVLMERQPTMLQSCVVAKETYLATGGLRPELRLAHDTHLFVLLGVGRSACAVAGLGTVQTADDDAGTRLTSIHSSRTRKYWEENLRLWLDVRHQVVRLTSQERRIVGSYVAEARWRLARHAFEEGRVIGGLGEVWKSFRASPRAMGKIVRRGLRGEDR
jgi:glycosyltransferase involved in cell wall biosynthesis